MSRVAATLAIWQLAATGLAGEPLMDLRATVQKVTEKNFKLQLHLAGCHVDMASIVLESRQ